MKTLFAQIEHTFFNKQLDFRVRLFNAMGMLGAAISLVGVILSVINGESYITTLLSIAAIFIACGLIYYASRSGRYQLCYMLTIFIIFLGFFPILFIFGGGYLSALPSYFIFAFVFTIFMLNGKLAFVMAAIELILYAGLCIYASRYPLAIAFLSTEADKVRDITIGFVVVSIALGVTLSKHFKEYDDQRRQLAEQNMELTRLNHMKAEFLGSVSHELKAPLTVISSFAQYSCILLEDETINRAELSGYMTDIMLEAERTERIVHELLDVAAMDNYGQIPLNRSPFFLADIVDIAAKTHFPVMNTNENILKISLPDDLQKINADRERVLEVLINLVSNAIKHTENGTITISARQEGENMFLAVADTGKGMTREFVSTLLERYPQTAGRQVSRTGLGLYFSDRVIAAHGGRLYIESELGQGTTVWFTLPMEGKQHE